MLAEAGMKIPNRDKTRNDFYFWLTPWSVTSMETDSFLQALRRFISRRGNIRTLRCDNGTNFVGAENELKKSLDEMDDERIKEFLLKSGTDWINWKKNTPAASHMRGVWERQIRTTRAILNSLLITQAWP